jgi:hypothetical protein
MRENLHVLRDFLFGDLRINLGRFLDLNSYGVVEMTQQEMLVVEGGTWLGNAFKAIGDAFVAVGEFFKEVAEAIEKLWGKLKSCF